MLLRKLFLPLAAVFVLSACSNSSDTTAGDPPIRNAKPGAGLHVQQHKNIAFIGLQLET